MFGLNHLRSFVLGNFVLDTFVEQEKNFWNNKMIYKSFSKVQATLFRGED
jgi:hypothetical protein